MACGYKWLSNECYWIGEREMQIFRKRVHWQLKRKCWLYRYHFITIQKEGFFKKVLRRKTKKQTKNGYPSILHSMQNRLYICRCISFRIQAPHNEYDGICVYVLNLILFRHYFVKQHFRGLCRCVSVQNTNEFYL